ncbi:MAG: M20/M25/M40 family metallo-hydrolase [Caldimicrobium sp.]
MINSERLLLEFKNLLQIESPSLKEGKLAYYLADIFEALGLKPFFDTSSEATGSEVGNLIVKIPGTISSSPLLFCAHLDTVGPCEGVEVIEENGVIRSNGKTILGADDKAGIAILVELVKALKETQIPHPPLEFVFTTAEEVGLLGAKNLDYHHLEAKMGFVLDAELPEEIIIGAPSSYQFVIKIKGKSAHAGLEPEKGINAIKILAQIIINLPSGRIDQETTMNLGKINGGKYINIVPDFAIAEGEIRSHHEEKLENLKKQIETTIREVIESYPKRFQDLPSGEVNFTRVFKAFHIEEKDPLLEIVKKAGERIGLTMSLKKKEGGSDANVFNERGIKCVILGTGMQKVHTTEEFIRVKDLLTSARLVFEIVKLCGENPL